MSPRLRVPPTRSVLLRLRKRREALLGAAELLERKRRILAQRTLEVLPRWEAARGETYGQLTAAYMSFARTRMRVTSAELGQLIAGSPPMLSLKLRRQVLAGVPMFEASVDTVALRPRFGLLGSAAEMDQAIVSMRDATADLARLAAQEATLRSLARVLKKTNRQLRMLRDHLIPLYEATVREIEDTLDEEERAYLFQIKRVR